MVPWVVIDYANQLVSVMEVRWAYSKGERMRTRSGLHRLKTGVVLEFFPIGVDPATHHRVNDKKDRKD